RAHLLAKRDAVLAQASLAKGAARSES
ncbi:MAG: hypothetical protein QOH33_1676, partial [Paraburkholderia sp.]|nr:hypothetical protein [Paraburkholderia sp.]